MGWMTRSAAVLAAGTVLAGCSSIDTHRGYINDSVLIASVQPGLDNRDSVRGTLGQPTLMSQFGEPVWYYVSSRTAQSPFRQPQIDQHSVLAVHFDADGNVASTDVTGIDQIARISPESDVTPTLGRERSFLRDLFGNIGSVGAPGTGNTGAPTQ